MNALVLAALAAAPGQQPPTFVVENKVQPVPTFVVVDKTTPGGGGPVPPSTARVATPPGAIHPFAPGQGWGSTPATPVRHAVAGYSSWLAPGPYPGLTYTAAPWTGRPGTTNCPPAG